MKFSGVFDITELANLAGELAGCHPEEESPAYIPETHFPYEIEELHHVWIPMRDGTLLASRIWLPVSARTMPVPAVLEYIPYRKNDATAMRDEQIHPYFAGHGYASVRVDMRGSGDSEGILKDEYLPLEQQDGLDILHWLAAQQWCDGSVGIFGKSWGGFDGLQIAACQPPELRAVISVCSSDDRYATDIHYVGGCLLGSEMLPWSSTFLAYTTRPPDPMVLGDRWREVWLERLEKAEPWVDTWLEHPLRDDYWRHGSVGDNMSALTCPVYMVGGWADPYSDAVLRFLDRYQGPCRGLIGPWAHQYPHDALPGTSIGFLQECLRWWDYWLKNIDTGIMGEPRLRVWMAGADYRQGRWLSEESLTSAQIRAQTYFLDYGQLSKETHGSRPVQFRGSQGCGLESGRWLAFGNQADLPPDQRGEDGLSLTFDSEPLEDAIEILGFPELTLACSADQPLALIAGRLCDVGVDGSSSLVSRGLLNLTHRSGDENPAPLIPGREYTVHLTMSGIAHRFEPGHRIRVALSPTYWPWAWPSPQPVTLTFSLGGATKLMLPLLDPSPSEMATSFLPPVAALPRNVERLERVNEANRRLTIDAKSGRRELTERYSCFPAIRTSDGLEYVERAVDRYSLGKDDPLSASVTCNRSVVLSRGNWRTTIVTNSTLTSDDRWFHVTNQLDAYEGSEHIFGRTWTRRHRRQFI